MDERDGRMVSAVPGRDQVRNDQEEALARIRAYRMAANELLHRADVVAGVARFDLGASWAKIGAALGMSQQGAMNRYTNPGAAGWETWVGLGWVEPEPDVPAPRPTVDDAALMGLDPFAEEDPDWHDSPV